MDSESRSREARARAEEALVRFALRAGEHARDFVVIGGLNPDFLAPAAPFAHLGTTDVDLLFELGFVYDRDELDFAWLDEVLSTEGFESPSGWRWDGTLGGARVRLELLSDVSDSQGQVIRLPGANKASVQNLDGPAAALHDPIERSLPIAASIRGERADAPAAVTLLFANLGGYLAAKSAALLGRNLPKDAYDLAFVIMYAEGGPRAAAAAGRKTQAAADRTPAQLLIRSAVSRLVDTDRSEALRAVELLAQAGDPTDPELLLTDVRVAARRFLAALDDGTGE